MIVGCDSGLITPVIAEKITVGCGIGNFAPDRIMVPLPKTGQRIQ